MMELNQINVTVPDGEVGLWSIQSFEVTAKEAAAYNLRCALRNESWLCVTPGRYKRLVHAFRGIVMSNTPMEVKTNLAFIQAATGAVLINGLGMGMVLTAILAKREVKTVVVVELDANVIALTAPHFSEHIDSGRLVIHEMSAYDYEPAKGQKFDAVWHDIWDVISDENLLEMETLKKKFAKHANWQGFWCESECRAMLKKIQAMCRAANAPYSAIDLLPKRSRPTI